MTSVPLASRSLRQLAAVAVLCLAVPGCLAQAGGGGAGGAGGGAGSGGASGAGSSSGAAGTATGGATGAATAGGHASGQSSNSAGVANTANGAQAGQQTPAQYAAAASPGSDPRKMPPAKPGALTLQQVLEAARLHNPTLAAAEQNLRGVRAQEIQAGVRANPYFGITATNVTNGAGGADNNNPYFYSAQISRLFERGNKRTYRLENARATTAQTEAQLQDTVRQTELNVRQAFTTMLIAKTALTLSQAQLADYRHEVEISRDRFQAGDLGKLDFERLDLQLGSFESDEQQAEITLGQASVQLQTLMGVNTPSTDFDVTGPVVPPAITQTHDALLTLALERRPDLRAAQAAVQAAEAASRLAIANGTADPTLEAEYDRNGVDNSAGFNVNIPLRIFDRNQGNKETARYQAQAARLTVDAARNQVGSDVNQAWIGYQHAITISDRFTQHYLDESTDVLSIARFAFDHGGLALIDYLDALRDARTATSNALNAYQQSWMALHTLSAASGVDLTP